MTKHMILTSAALILLLITFSHCSEDKNPSAPDPKPESWGSVLMTDNQGGIILGDQSDWCLPSTVIKGEIPDEYALYPAYPNPAIDSAIIVYDLPAISAVEIRITDSTGAIRKRLVEADQPAGEYSISWPLDDSAGVRLSSGIYRCAMTAGSFSCFGDIEILPDSRQVTVYSVRIADTLAAVYASPVEVGGLTLKFATPGTIGFISYGPATGHMVRLDTLRADTLIVALLPDIADLRPMPAGTHVLFRTSTSGTPRLVAVDASDSLGYDLPRVVRNLTF